MEKMKSKFCPAMWFSGFFGLGALVHIARYFLGFGLIVNGHAISLRASGILALVAGILSVGLLIVSLKRPCESGAGSGSTCCK